MRVPKDIYVCMIYVIFIFFFIFISLIIYTHQKKSFGAPWGTPLMGALLVSIFGNAICFHFLGDFSTHTFNIYIHRHTHREMCVLRL